MKTIINQTVIILLVLLVSTKAQSQNSCGNDAGQMPQAFFPACAGDFVASTALGAAVADPNSSLLYLLLNSSADIGNIIAYNSTGLFFNDGILPFQDLFISAYVGPLNADGSPILNDPCADVALPGTPIRFYPPIQLEEYSSICDQVTGCRTVEFTVSGGAPSFFIDQSFLFLEYQIAGDFSGVIDNPGDLATFTICEKEGYEIYVENDGLNCNAFFEVDASCKPCSNVQFGCTDPIAANYNPDAVCDDGSCSQVPRVGLILPCSN